MEEEKAAAYYDELIRKGEGAARFKQGLGFSTNSDAAPKPGSALASSSSFLSNFVRASSPSKASQFEKQAQLQSVQNKLKKKPTDETGLSRVSDRSRKPGDDDDGHSTRRRSRSRERRRDRDSKASGRRSRSRDKYRERDRESRRRSRSRSRDRHRDRVAERRRRRRSRSRSDSDEHRRHGGRGRSRSISPRERKLDRRRRSRSSSPQQHRRLEKNESDVGDRRKVGKMSKEKNAGIDYALLIQGYDKMVRFPISRLSGDQMHKMCVRFGEKFSFPLCLSDRFNSSFQFSLYNC